MKKNIFISLLFVFLILLGGYYYLLEDNKGKNITNSVGEEKKETEKVGYNIEKLTKLLNEQKFSEVLPILEEEYKKNPTNINNNLNYANAVLNMASITKKEKVYGNSIIKILNYTLTLDPKNSETYRLLGYANEIIENYDEAFKNYNKSIELDPNNYLAYGNRGHTYGLIGEINNEEEDLLKAYNLNGKIDQVIINLARIYLGKGDIEKATNYFNKTLEVSKNNRFKSEALYSLGIFKLNEKQFNEAENQFLLSIKIDPNFEIGYIGLAREEFELYLSQVKKDKDKVNTLLVTNAINNLKIAIKLNPEKTTAYYYLALLNMNIGFYNKTEKNFKKALEVLNKDITLSKTEKDTMKILINKYYKNETNK